MTQNYQKIGDYISLLDKRNSDGSITNLMGISIDKCYIPSVANVIGTDLHNYKVIKKGQFACSLMQVSRDQRIPLAMYTSDEPAIMSPAYMMFEVNRPDEILPEYMELWFKRAEFDREASFYAVGGVRGSLDWEDFCKMKLPVPPISEQRKIVHDYQVITNRIEILKRINDNLAAQAQSVFLHLFADNESLTPATIADIALNVTDGVHNTVHDDPEGEYLLLSCKNIKGGFLTVGSSERRISVETFKKLRRRTKLAKGDVLISSVGTVGELLLLNTDPANYEFQRSVAMVKPNPAVVSPAYLYESLVCQKAELINAAHGAVQQCLFISDIADFPIGIPSPENLRTFDEIVAPMFDSITANEAELLRLTTLRDTLLPHLMSGELDVSELDL